MKQNDFISCVACVAAMATNTTVEDFEKFMGKHGPYSDFEFEKYLMPHGYSMGFGASVVVEDGEVVVRFSVNDFPAYVIVESERLNDIEHAVYWDGKKIIDPNPESKDGRSLESYKIISWFPIINHNEKQVTT